MGRKWQAIRMSVIVALWLAAGAAAAQGTIFSCVANGRTYTGDRPPAPGGEGPEGRARGSVGPAPVFPPNRDEVPPAPASASTPAPRRST